jgi:hypothetical protein
VGEKMLDHLLKIPEHNKIVGIETQQSMILIRDIFNNLRDSTTKAKIMGDIELQYLISIALEATIEKLLLREYEIS